MPPTEPVPEEDRQEQEAPVSRDTRDLHAPPPDAPEADVLEQELPIDDEVGGPPGIDAERTEPLSDEDRGAT